MDLDFFTLRWPLVLTLHCTEKKSTRREQRDGENKTEVSLLTGQAVFFGIEKFGEARVFLEEGKILVVSGVVAIFRAELDGHL